MPALAICLAALTLGACGVKGALEPPPGAKLAASDAASDAVPDANTSATATPKIFTSESRVESVGQPDIIPQMPPKQWTKDANSAGQTNSPGSGQRAKKGGASDKPFVLDWLL
jgi:predicted small lipoprotein YifL